MARLLIEYKGYPAIVEHSLLSVSNIEYVVVFKQGFEFKRSNFDNVEEALDFNPEEATIVLRFICIYSTSGGTFRVISSKDGKLIISMNEINANCSTFQYSIKFNVNQFIIKKLNKRNLIFSYVLNRRIKKYIRGENIYEMTDSFTDLVPDFDDMFLEALFVLDTISINSGIGNKNELEAFLLQSKLNYEGKYSFLNKSENEGEKELFQEDEIQLLKLIGLDEIKLELEELRALARLRKKRILHGLPVMPSSLHLVFKGNPGTGKTSVARLLGQIYYDIGLLPSNRVVEVTRTDLVGEYVGHTAPKTQKVFESALGGILFIDEAYSLYKSGKDFGNEAIETLLKLMEDNREKIVLIIAGYPHEIDELLFSNPGLKSRFSKILNFRDYSKEELLEIYLQLVDEHESQLTEGARYKLETIIDETYDSGVFSANARIVRNLFEDTIKRQSKRLSRLANPNREEITKIIDLDIPDLIS